MIFEMSLDTVCLRSRSVIQVIAVLRVGWKSNWQESVQVLFTFNSPSVGYSVSQSKVKDEKNEL